MLLLKLVLSPLTEVWLNLWVSQPLFHQILFESQFVNHPGCLVERNVEQQDFCALLMCLSSTKQPHTSMEMLVRSSLYHSPAKTVD